MNTLVSIIIVAVLGVIGNIIYFEYRLKKERRREVLKNRLTNLLLPLYYNLKEDDFMLHAWIINTNADPYDYVSDKPERLLGSLQKIIKENLYLADDELHEACLMFIEWAHKADKDERFQRVHSGSLVEDDILRKFIETVYRKYNETRKEYIK